MNPRLVFERLICSWLGVAIVIKASGALFWLGALILISKNLRPSDFGVFIVGMTLANLLAITAPFGYVKICAKYLPIYWKKNQAAHVALLRRTFIVTAGLCFVFFVLGLGCFRLSEIGYLPFQFDVTLTTALLVVVSVLPISLLNIVQEWLLSQRRTVVALIPDSIIKPIVMASLIISLDSSVFPYRDLEGMLILLVVSLTFALIIGFVLALLVPQPAHQNEHVHLPRERKRWQVDAPHLFITTIISNAIQRGDILVFALLFEPAVVAVYAVAQRVISVLSPILDAVKAYVRPMLSLSVRAGNTNEVVFASDRGSLLYGLVGSFYFLSILLGAYPILALFGKEYVPDAYFMAIVLSTGKVAMLSAGPSPMHAALTSLNAQRTTLQFCLVVFMVAVTYISGKVYGIYGATFAVALVTGLNAWAHNILLFRYFGLETGLFAATRRTLSDAERT